MSTVTVGEIAPGTFPSTANNDKKDVSEPTGLLKATTKKKKKYRKKAKKVKPDDPAQKDDQKA